MVKFKPLIAVGHDNREPWNSLRRVQEETWISNASKKVDVIYVKSKNSNVFLEELDRIHEILRFKKLTGKVIGKLDYLLLKYSLHSIPSYTVQNNGDFLASSHSMYLTMNRRTFSFFKWFVYSTNYTHLFTTTSASYLRIDKFYEMMATLAHENLLLAGSKFSSSGKAKLVSGSGRLFSRDLIEEFLKTHKTFPAWRIDDVAISLHAQVLHANFRYWDRFDITCEADLQKFKEECLEHQDIFHFRIKTHERPKLDAEIMMNLHDFFQK